MIVYLAKGVNFLTIIVQNIIVFASSVGQIIVLLFTTAIFAVYQIIKNILIFFQIIYEDNVSIFTDDLPSSAGKICDAFHDQWSSIYKIVSSLTDEMFLEVNTIISNVKFLVSTIFHIIGEVLQLLMKAIILSGDTLWLLITFIPVHLPYLLKVFFKSIKDSVVCNAIDTYMALLRITDYLSEVPLESFMGIITAMIIVRSFIHFRDTIHSHIIDWYWILVRKVTYIYYMIYNYCTNSEVRTIARIVGGQPLTIRNNEVNSVNDNYEDSTNATDALCIICQERQKCVLTLPCRHVCLCTECCMRLYGYQRTCPICRTFIYHSVNIYL